MTGLDAGISVFHHRSGPRLGPEPPRRFEEQGRIGLAGKTEPRGVHSVDADIE